MVLHTDQQHPHVHMVVKAESEHGQRLHVDKAMLRTWREDFARLMREQGIAANATPRAIRGRNKGKTRDAIYRAQHRGVSTAVRQRVTDVAKQLVTRSFHDPARSKLLETCEAIVGGWLQIADTLDLQGEAFLAGDVRNFARRLPSVLTDREAIAVRFAQQLRARRVEPTDRRSQDIERTR